jgi:hypothetical protein
MGLENNMKTRIHVLLFCIGFFYALVAMSDTIGNYMRIASQIPQMEMKATPDAQAWARSARNVLAITTESIAETLNSLLATKTSRSSLMFCLPEGSVLTASSLNEIIQAYYKKHTDTVIDGMSVSQYSIVALKDVYPCQSNAQPSNQLSSLGIGVTPPTQKMVSNNE